MPSPPRGFVTSLVLKVLPRLKFPQLFALTATLFLLDLVIPDLIPLADELLLGLATLLLGMWREDAPDGPKPPMKDVTPQQ